MFNNPDNLEVTEEWGKEGQHGFAITTKDTSSKMFGFIEVTHGYPIEDSSSVYCKDSKIYSESIFLKKHLTWTSCSIYDNIIFVKTENDNGISVWATSDKKEEVDTMISIIGTLYQK